MEKVYICSAYHGDVEENSRKASEYCRYAAVECGVMPIAPHLLFPQFLDDYDETERNMGIQMGLELLRECSALWYFGDRITPGMVEEITTARELGIPVQYVPDEDLNLEQEGGMRL